MTGGFQFTTKKALGEQIDIFLNIYLYVTLKINLANFMMLIINVLDL